MIGSALSSLDGVKALCGSGPIQVAERQATLASHNRNAVSIPWAFESLLCTKCWGTVEMEKVIEMNQLII